MPVGSVQHKHLLTRKHNRYHDVHKVLEMHSEWEEDIDPELAV